VTQIEDLNADFLNDVNQDILNLRNQLSVSAARWQHLFPDFISQLLITEK